MTVSEWLAEARVALAGVDSPKLEAELLLCKSLEKPRIWLHAHMNDVVRLADAYGLLEARISGEPLAYILQHREFYGREFAVGPGVLIPRHETELLVAAGIEAIDTGRKVVLDLCCGTGIIGITLKLERPDSEVTLSDIAKMAHRYSESNRARLGAEVKLVRSDLFEAFSGHRFDLIVCNPPYIGRGEAISYEVRCWEPEEALFADEDGFAIIKRLAVESPPYLNPRGQLWLEVGHTQSLETATIFTSAGWKHLGTKIDLLGHERVLGFEPLP